MYLLFMLDNALDIKLKCSDILIYPMAIRKTLFITEISGKYVTIHLFMYATQLCFFSSFHLFDFIL